MQPEKVLSRYSLPNGLTLEFRDLSRPTAGDRWQVVVEAGIAVPVIPANLPPELPDRLEEVSRALGSEVVFAKQEIRNFVAAGELSGLIKQIVADLLAAGVSEPPRICGPLYPEEISRIPGTTELAATRAGSRGDLMRPHA
jgi:hypothetical protein